jgi:hypothetical protein
MHLEIVRFTVPQDSAATLVGTRPAMLQAMRERHPALRSATLTRIDDTTWVDVVAWDGLAEAQRAAEDMAGIPAAAEWAALISEVSSFEHAEVVHTWPGSG